MVSRASLRLSLLLLLPAAACSPPATGTDAASGDSAVMDVAPGDGAAPADASPDTAAPQLEQCNPLGVGAVCGLPFPSMYYARVDSTSATGYRLALDTRALPVSASPQGDSVDGNLDPTAWNRADGFSAAAPAIVWFSQRLDPASLAGPRNIAQSVMPGNSTVILDMATNERVPHFAELDATATTAQRQVLIIRPMVRLQANHRYAVVVTRALHALDGSALPVSPGYQAIVNGRATDFDPRLARIEGRYADIHASMAAAGIQPSDALVAWDYVTASERYLTGNVVSMRDTAMTMVGPMGTTFTVTRTEDNFNSSILRRIQGTISVPLFLNSPAPTTETRMNYGADGYPAVVPAGTYNVNFVAMVPRAATTATGPLPMLLFGHGLFGDALGQLGGANDANSSLQTFANTRGYVLVATDWTGLSSSDRADAPAALADFNHLGRFTDRLQQSLVNAMVLFRTAKNRFNSDPAFQVSGHGVINGDQAYYYGISLGGIMGTSFMGYSTDCTRGALNVNGGNWSLLMQRSLAWPAMSPFLTMGYRRPEDQQLLLVLAQQQFDFSDPINVAPHLLRDRLPGVPEKVLLSQESVGDVLVTNLSTEMIARTAGFTMLTPSPTMPYGITGAAAPLASGMSVWTINPSELPPDTNQPASMDTGTHDISETIPVLSEQLARFLRPGGVIEQTCTGVCSFH